MSRATNAASAPDSCKVATPADLATSMVVALGDTPTAAWLDPCVGAGVFVKALVDAHVDPQRLTAVDLDRVKSRSHGVIYVSGKDFVRWSAGTRRRFDRIIANPPYVSLSKIPAQLQQEACAVRLPNGKSISLRANYWVAFLCASLNLLRPGAGICFVLPASWDYADYARSLRDDLPLLFREFEVLRCFEPMFPVVQDGCVVVVGKGFQESHRSFARTEHRSQAALARALHERRRATRRHDETPQHRTASLVSLSPNTRLLSDVMDIRIGGVTGDARFFLLNEKRRMQLNLPTRVVRPVVSKARHLVQAELTAQAWRMLKDRGERIWLFDPLLSMLNHPAVRDYLSLGPENGGCIRDRFKLAREPWHKTPLPAEWTAS